MKRIILILAALYGSFYVTAQSKTEELKNKARSAHDSTKLEIYIELGLIYDSQDKFDSSVFYNKEAYKVAKRLNREGAAADALNNIGTSYYAYSKYDTAIDYYLQALKIYDKQKLDAAAIGTMTNIAGIYSEQNNYKQALETLFRAMDLNATKVKDSILLTFLLGNIGRNYTELKQTEKVHQYVDEGLKIVDLQYKRTNLISIDSVKLSIIRPYLQMLDANAYKLDKNFKRSNVLFKVLLEEQKKKEGIKDQIELLELMSENYNEMKQFDSAVHYTNEALTLLKNDSIPESYRDIYNQQATAYAGLGNYKKAFESHSFFKQISDSILNKENVAITTEMQTKYETEKKDQAILQLNKEKKAQKTIIALVIGAAVVALGLLIFVLRSRSLQRKLFKQKEELLIKEKEIETNTLQKKMTELEQMALRAQMNPHFIFNSLNSVQHFVMKQDIEGVNKYLGAFAHLVRQTLNNSGKQFVSIDEEVKYLDTYLSLEKMKSNDRFNYSINVSNDIDRSATFIPGMILQPFVENSIKHGVAYKEDNGGKIEIHVSKNGKLVCIIEDNGVGRKKAGEVKSSDGNSEYESKGMSITMNRIETINKMYDANISVQIDDINDSHGKPAGTKVQVAFPIEED